MKDIGEGMEKESNRLEKHYSNKVSQRKRETMQGRGKIIRDGTAYGKRKGEIKRIREEKYHERDQK